MQIVWCLANGNHTHILYSTSIYYPYYKIPTQFIHLHTSSDGPPPCGSLPCPPPFQEVSCRAKGRKIGFDGMVGRSGGGRRRGGGERVGREGKNVCLYIGVFFGGKAATQPS